MFQTWRTVKIVLAFNIIFTMMKKVTVIDGGFSTQLGLITGDVIDGDPLWCCRYLATNPEIVLKTHLEYLTAGAEIITTNSYQASILGFMTHLGLDQKSSYKLFKESVKIARKAINIYLSQNPKGESPKIAGSVGPYGACLNDGSEYSGNYVDRIDMGEILEWHRPRIKALIEEGVDFLAIETIPALSEALALLSLMKEYPQQKIWLSFQCKDDSHTAHGEAFGEAVKKCWETNKDQLIAVGCNCVNPKFVKKLLSSVEKEEMPLIVYPNSGEEYSSGTGWSGEIQGLDFTEQITEWLDLGVTYIGGCCRTDARYIKKIRNEVKNWSKLNGM